MAEYDGEIKRQPTQHFALMFDFHYLVNNEQ